MYPLEKKNRTAALLSVGSPPVSGEQCCGGEKGGGGAAVEVFADFSPLLAPFHCSCVFFFPHQVFRDNDLLAATGGQMRPLRGS